MAKEILVNVTSQEIRIALLQDAILEEIHIERHLNHGLIGNIYKGKITRLLPGIQSAFVDIGLEKSGFLHITDILPKDKASDKETSVDICHLFKTGQEILVQVYKNPLGTKGARLTTELTIPSRHLVLTPNILQVSISQKITDEEERKRLASLISPSSIGGYIFRTAAEGVTQEDVNADKEFLSNMWSGISQKIGNAKVGDLIHEEIPIVLKLLRDFVGYKIEKIHVDDLKTKQQMQQFAEHYVPQLAQKIEYYSDSKPIFDMYSVEEEIQKGLRRKIYLKSGGHLIFDQTEAMTTIDVNTGSYLGSDNLEQTIFKTNLEAVEVIARQIRLRNLGGIIIIDFIDMTETLHKEEILNALTSVFKKDPARIKISELSSLGLVQLTRKRERESLEHTLCVTCPLCHRRGSIRSVETISYEIFREIKRIGENSQWPGFVIVASKEVIDYLEEKEAGRIAELEAQLAKRIKFQIESTFNQENYNILPLSERN